MRKTAKRWVVLVDENGGEYVGRMVITATVLKRDPEHRNIIYADGVRIEWDEEILDIKEQS